jgi:Protein similar to CwfJ C-terminus 2/Protein similar to CwfJ C-terminus 1
MLSGIRTGKKKKKPVELAEPPPASACSHDAIGRDNVSVADRLRQSLATGIAEARVTTSTSLLGKLEQRGRIESSRVVSSKSQHDNMVVELPKGQVATRKQEEDMTIQELVTQERRQNQEMSWDEQMTRNMARLGKNRKRKLKTSDDSDEEVEQMKKWLPGATNAKEGTANEDRAIKKAQVRDRHRLMNEKIQEDKVTSKCAWWLESSSFRKHRLLALGDHISLVMAPPNASLIAGNHFYLVPLKHTPSFVSADGDAWREVLRFQTSLQNLYARQGKSVMLLETILDHSKGLWQTKLEVVPVPFAMLQDAPMYFSSSMQEQVEEWGTHSKLLKVSTDKPLPAVVPKGFPYFYVDWGKIATSPSATGYAQIIESESFPRDFGLDTVAAMLDLDPIRLQRKQSYGHEDEQQQISDFLKLWEKVDWTKELDSAGVY